MGIINVLDFHVANLIAAGEVVDRPASVVKELLENAIDSGADTVTVEIKRGGVSFIRVSDNGCGMAREDVPVALKRHATSKIREADDLNSIATLGFRGEALAAIAAVSELRIMTRRGEDATGTLLESSGGRVTNLADAGCPQGTSVIVENLFFNTPARLKFLKKDGTEAANVAAYVEKIALSHPEITLRFIMDGELKYATAGDGSRRSVIYAVLGRDFSKKSIEIRGGFDGVSVSGYIGSPENVRGNRNLQIFFINNRYIRSKTVSAALEQAFSTYIPSDKFPCAVLYLQMHAASVDVNVHPAKLEVKFSNERVVFESVYYAVRGALESSLSRPELKLVEESARKQAQRTLLHPFVPVVEGRGGDAPIPAKDLLQTLDVSAGEQQSSSGGEPQATAAEQTKRESRFAQEKTDGGSMPKASAYCGIKESPAVEETALDHLPISVPRGFGAPAREENSVRTTVRTDDGASEARHREKEAALTERGHDAVRPEAKAHVSDTAAVPDKTPVCADEADVPLAEAVHTVPQYRMVGELFQCYVVLECGDTMYLVDKHAAHERILFEQFKAGVRSRETTVQALLVPLDVSMTAVEMNAAEEFGEEIRAIGFDFLLQDTGVRILAIPSFLSVQAAADAFSETVSNLCDGHGGAALTQNARWERALFQASCKAAIKAGRVYDAAHLKWICDRVLSDPAIRYCPHGRPVCFTMTKSMIEGRFGRI
ncbi:MAG: DNA mismatch repair endonuclease MutL [Clostridia bacterium]|nr:DNA mismatch repair endonuclease MutL [Clostridia bacterium]